MGTAIAKVGTTLLRVAKPQNIGKLVYSTGGNKGTFFDALINTYSKSHVAKGYARQVNSAAMNFKGKVDDALKPLCDDIGTYGSRIKKTNKIKGKVPKGLGELTVDDAVAYITSGKFRNVIGDGNGARIIIDKPKDVDKLIKRLIKEHKKGKSISIACVENYHGKGITPYINDKLMAELQKLSYKDGAGVLRNTTVAGKIKKAGYTRTNMDLYINGVRIEFQVGGRHTTRFGEVEHFLYDMRQTGVIDLSHLSSEQRQLFYKMREAYQPIIKDNVRNTRFEEYMTEIWNTLRVAEEKGLKEFPKLPKPPKGIPEILSGENLMLLEENAICNKLLLMG